MRRRNRTTDTGDTWLTIDEAAAALDVGTKRAYQIASDDRWRHTNTTPRGYHVDDVRRTHLTRKEQQS